MEIIKLSDQTINQIAAGEVIERPASVVKELVENSIDASSNRIQVFIWGSGRDKIKIVDNGIGISMEQLELALERHATSKLSNDDLTKINFLGFRGEALPSIASVSNFSISSCKKNSTSSWELKSLFGRKKKLKPSSITLGTSIIVKDLFAKIPARLKFLKTDKTETALIVDAVKKLSIVNPKISFELYIDEVQHLSYIVDKRELLYHRVSQVLGKEFIENSIKIEGSRNNAIIYGYVGLPTFSKGSGRWQYIYVNGRPVSDRLISGALRGAYSDYLPKNRFPVVVLFIEINTESLDVNVHPNKSEVRFKDEQNIRALIVGNIKRSLVSSGLQSSNFNSSRVISLMERSRDIEKVQKINMFRNNFLEDSSIAKPKNEINIDRKGNSEPYSKVYKEEEGLDDYPLGSAVAQIHKNYIVAQAVDGLILIDQHAAHERIVYEELKKGIFGAGLKSQVLLIQEIIELDELSVSTLIEHTEDFKKLGLIIEPNDSKSVIVSETPALLGEVDVQKLLEDLSDNLVNENNSKSLKDLLYEVCSAMACHGSVRAGRMLNVTEMNSLLRKMEITPNSGQCNHGRPTYVKLKLEEIETIFGRK